MFKSTSRQIGNVVIVDMEGRFTIGEPLLELRELVRQLFNAGHRSLILNFSKVSYVDSSGLGETVSLFTKLQNANGALKLLRPAEQFANSLKYTKLMSVFEIFDDETTACANFVKTNPTDSALHKPPTVP